MITKELTCIGCPMGCNITVTLDDNKNVLDVKGFTCAIGEKYARTEVVNPERVVTSSVYVDDVIVEGKKVRRMCSVKTKGNVPKDKICDVIKAIKTAHVKPPINIGDVIVKNVCNTGVDVVATRKIK